MVDPNPGEITVRSTAALTVIVIPSTKSLALGSIAAVMPPVSISSTAVLDNVVDLSGMIVIFDLNNSNI